MESIIVPIQEIESEAEYVIYSEQLGVLSEHCTESEARMAFYKQAAARALGERLPVIFARQEPHWVALN